MIRRHKKQPLTHGPVLIVAGVHTGKRAMYDDDKNEQFAIVYLEPDSASNYFNAPFAIVKTKSLVNIDELIPKVLH